MLKLCETLSLNGDWLIHEDQDNIGYEAISKVQDSFIASAVPGNIQADLESAQMLNPLWYGKGDTRLYGVATKNWWYKKEFILNKVFCEKRITVYFDGVDYSCEVYLNGNYVGAHSGMFERFEFDITSYVNFDTSNVLWVKIDKMPDELLPYIINSDGRMSGVGTPYFFVTANNKIRQTLKGLKSPANCSYDWGTNIYTLGIWKNVTIKATGAARIDWVQVKTNFSDENTDKATVPVTLEINSNIESDISVVFTLKGHGMEKTEKIYAMLKKGMNMVTAEMKVDYPELWWPNGYGAQPLYEMAASILGMDGYIYDEKVTRFAFRDIKWTDCEGAPENFQFKYQLILNGMPIRTMGSNLAAMDLLFGRIGDRGVHYIEMAKNCNMNTLRLHGGQIVYPQSLYDAADESGIMLFSEFPIGNCCMENDLELMDNIDKTVVNIVKQLRNHPSIIEWGGGNELEWYFKVDEDRTAMFRQEKAVYSADDSRLFRYTCPVPGSRHSPWDYNPDLHYKIYNLDIGDNFKIAPNMRFGEFGCHTPSNIEVWYRDIPPESRWPINEEDPALIRKNAVQAVFASSMWFGLDITERFFGKADDLEMAVKAGQFLGAEGVRYSMDALRAKGKNMGGFTSWDYNEPWPNGAGSFMIDYDGRPLMMYYFVKQALAPVSLQLKYDSLLYDFFEDTFAELILVSDSPYDTPELYWKWTARDRQGNVFGTDSGMVFASIHIVKNIGKIKINPPVEMLYGPTLIELALTKKDGEIVSERVYLFGCKGTAAPLRGLLKEDMNDHPYGGTYITSGISGGKVKKTNIAIESVRAFSDEVNEYLELTIKNTGSMTAMFIEVHPKLEYKTILYIDNNFVSIPPLESRKITVCGKKKAKALTLSQMGFDIDCWNANNLTVSPDKSVLLYMGRRDSICREFSQTVEEMVQKVSATDAMVDAAKVSYKLDGKLEIVFEADVENAGREALLLLYICDNDPVGMGHVEIKLNGCVVNAALKAGLGVQTNEPWHLAFPKTLTFSIPKGITVKGQNTLVIETVNCWFTFDALVITIE